jgi:uncharacterized protein
MSLSMFQASVPVFIRTLTNLKAILEKGRAHIAAKNLDESHFVNYRLFPDMLPFSAQVRIACDMVKGGGARLAGIEPPKFEDNETTLEQLVARVQKTLDFLATLKAEQIDGSEAREITLPMRAGPVSFKGQDYLLHFVLPNLYFHATTTYGILRHNGVEVGKWDFLGKP